MTCEACTDAEHVPSHIFMAGCKGCAARSVARSQLFAKARRAGAQPWDYRELLRMLGVSHDEVKAAWRSDAINREPATGDASVE